MINFAALESCRSGRTGQSRKLLTAQVVRGFESLTLRHRPPKPKRSEGIGGLFQNLSHLLIYIYRLRRMPSHFLPVMVPIGIFETKDYLPFALSYLISAIVFQKLIWFMKANVGKRKILAKDKKL